MATDTVWSRFRRWRRHRPFWGGLFLVLAAVELFVSANLDLGGMQVHLGPQGFLSYLLPSILLTCGLLAWFTPPQRIFYGIVALLAALYSFVGLNLGGFILGMILGIVGGGLVIAWGPPRRAVPPGVVKTPQPYVDQVRPAVQDPTTIVPGFPQHGAPRTGKGPKALVIVLISLTLTAGLLVGGSSLPASAEECPEGMPSRSTTPSTTAAAKKSPKASKSPARKKPSASASGADKAEDEEDEEPETDESGNPILEGIEDFFNGIGDLLGIGEKAEDGEDGAEGGESASPSASPSPSTSESGSAGPTRSAKPSETAGPGRSSSAKPSPSGSGSDVPCLGARQYGLLAGADDIPYVSQKPGVMKVGTLTMYNSTYDGVVDMPVLGGESFPALKFSMDKAENKPFNLTMDENHDAQTVITSDALTTEGSVRFYTPEFKGKLFGLIPVTFTPESPPPLTLPVLWFTDVEIQLAYVRCDKLTGDPLKVTEVVG